MTLGRTRTIPTQAEESIKSDPALDERRRKAREYRTKPASGVVHNAISGLHYSVFFVSDFAPSACDQQRDSLERRGFEPRNGPRYKGETPAPEFVPDRPSAEIWACPIEIQDDEWRDSLLDCLRSWAWVSEEVRNASNRSVRGDLLNLAFEHHRALKRPGGNTDAQSAWARIESLVNNTPVKQLGSRTF